MNLPHDQIAWLLKHYYYPMKVKGDRCTLPGVCIRLEAQGLVKVERFPIVTVPKGINQPGGGFAVLVVSPTTYGWKAAAHAAPISILQKWGDRLSDQFLEENVAAQIPLAALPELLVGDNLRWRRLAIKVAKQLGKEHHEF